MMVVLVVLINLQLLRIFAINLRSVVSAVSLVAMYGYTLIVLFSIYDLFKEEHEMRLIVKFTHPGSTGSIV